MACLTSLEENCAGLACDTFLEISESLHKDIKGHRGICLSFVSLCAALWTGLEKKFQPELHLPHWRDQAGNRTRAARRRDLRRERAARRRRQELSGGRAESRVRNGELRRVEDVEHLRAELQPQLLVKLN